MCGDGGRAEQEIDRETLERLRSGAELGEARVTLGGRYSAIGFVISTRVVAGVDSDGQACVLELRRRALGPRVATHEQVLCHRRRHRTSARFWFGAGSRRRAAGGGDEWLGWLRRPHGGAPRNPKNLWPEPRTQADKSDPLETKLKRQVCKSDSARLARL